MQKHLLLLFCGLLLLFGCAKPPVEDLNDTRSLVAKAYAQGASTLAPEEYRIASEALAEAEELVRNGSYRKASQRLELARRYGLQANDLAEEKQAALAAEQRRKLEEAKAREIRRKQELKQQKEQQEVKIPEPPELKPPPEPQHPPEPQLLDLVEVAPGENLQSISARRDVYGDGLLWPLIYKANRDQIKDPQEIFPGQIFKIPRDKNSEEMEAARQEARELQLFK
jgi:nucleoid-associated protein YgaU